MLRLCAEYGFTELLEQSKLYEHYPFLADVKPLPKKSRGERARLLLEELGPTFIKFGQILSTRADLIPDDVLMELEKLVDQAKPVPFEEVEGVFREELGKELKQVFKKFDKEPIASASLGQVHFAVLRSGERVAVKIQRPEARKVVEADLEIMKGLAEFMEENVPEAKKFAVVEMVEEFSHTIRKEMDYKHEGRSADRLRREFEGDETIKIPKVYWQYTTQRVLVEEFLDGKKLNDLKGVSPKIRKKVIGNGARALLKQIMEQGFFHADPHLGNFLVLKNGKVGVIDFGMVGYVDDELKEVLEKLFSSLAAQEPEGVAEQFSKLCKFEGEKKRNEFVRDLTEIMAEYQGISIREFDLQEFVQDFIDTARKHEARVSPRFMLLAKMLVMLDGIGRRFDPDFNVFRLASEYAEKKIKEESKPRNIAKRAVKGLSSLAFTLKNIPTQLSEVLQLTREGRLQIEFEHKGLEKTVENVDRTINKVSVSMIVAALIVASALIILSGRGPQLYGFSVIGLIGFALSAIIGFTLIMRMFQFHEL